MLAHCGIRHFPRSRILVQLTNTEADFRGGVCGDEGSWKSCGSSDEGFKTTAAQCLSFLLLRTSFIYSSLYTGEIAVFIDRLVNNLCMSFEAGCGSWIGRWSQIMSRG
ncbi:hypothetical protein V2G26_010520 [Clonostachys chloroleuca]